MIITTFVYIYICMHFIEYIFLHIVENFMFNFKIYIYIYDNMIYTYIIHNFMPGFNYTYHT